MTPPFIETTGGSDETTEINKNIMKRGVSAQQEGIEIVTTFP